MRPDRRLTCALIAVLAVAAAVSCGCGRRPQQQGPPVLRVGHVGHDHQTALYVACLNGERFKADYGLWLEPIRPKKRYAVMDNGSKVAELELFKSGGGSKMPTMLAQGHFEVGLGGVAPVMAFVDRGSPMRIISPLHAKGDMLVVAPACPATDWPSFIQYVRSSTRPVRIGYKNPIAVAKLIFEGALQHEKIPFSDDPADAQAKVRMILLKGERNLVPALANGVVDGYVSNNPWCAIAQSKNVGRIIADLNELPPGTWKDHPCCCVAATEQAIADQPHAVRRLLELIIAATDYINNQPTMGFQAASDWIGTTLELESQSMPTSGYSTADDETFRRGTLITWQNMKRLGLFSGTLLEAKADQLPGLVLDFDLLRQARTELAKRKRTK